MEGVSGWVVLGEDAFHKNEAAAQWNSRQSADRNRLDRHEEEVSDVSGGQCSKMLPLCPSQANNNKTITTSGGQPGDRLWPVTGFTSSRGKTSMQRVCRTWQNLQQCD